MDYKGKGEEELDLVKDEGLRVFKRYNHWSYAVKEDSGERGWVPVCHSSHKLKTVETDGAAVVVHWQGRDGANSGEW